jgi:uncharacterized membrane protein
VRTGRVEAFSDGVIAILITIMVLELPVPEGGDWGALRDDLPVLLAYVLSFVYLGIYWSNHHHLLQATDRVSGATLWANLHLLFWLSLVPFVTAWMSEHYGPAPVEAYGLVLLLAALAYSVLVRVLISANGPDSRLRAAVGRDVKGLVSLGLYTTGVLLALVVPLAGIALYVVVALIWLVPDRRVERRLAEPSGPSD